MKAPSEDGGRIVPEVPSLRRGAVIVTGHQPEWFHPGVWAKNFFAAGVANKVGGSAINLVVDNDTAKSTSIRVPIWPEVSEQTVSWDDWRGEEPYETRVVNETVSESFLAKLADITKTWPFEPIGLTPLPSREGPGEGSAATATLPHILQSVASAGPSPSPSLKGRGGRKTLETEWGADLTDLRISELSTQPAFLQFADEIIRDHDRFRVAYNAALAAYRKSYGVRSRNHPAPDLAPDELPFWRIANHRRERMFVGESLENLRPRALTLTLFVRLHIADYFVHGLGGGLYERVNDTIIREYYRREPPPYGIVTGTLRLPFPKTERHAPNPSLRRLWWNPHEHADYADMRQHDAIVAMPQTTRAERRQRYHAFRELQQSLRRGLWKEQYANLESRWEEFESVQSRQAILDRRDYAWLLFPESKLKNFLQSFL